MIDTPPAPPTPHRAAGSTGAATAARPGRTVRRPFPGDRAALVAAPLLGVVAGALTSYGQAFLPGPLGGLANAVAPWLVVPFVVGALARRGRWAAVAGVLVCLGQVAGYYLTADLRGFPVGASWVVLWLACTLPGGVVAGAAGRSWWDGGTAWGGRARGLGAAVLVGAWLAEALVTYGVVLGYPGHAAVFVAVGVVAFVVLGRHGGQHAQVARWLGPVAVLACAGFAGVHAVT